MKSLVRALMPHTIRPRRIIAGPLSGTWLVTSWHDYPAGLTGRTEGRLLDWFARNVQPGETWIDVGAYCGYTAFALARLVGPTGRVLAFEPVTATAGCLDQGRALNGLAQVKVLPFGLGAADTLETRRLVITRGMADATLPPDSTRSMVDVPLVRFDWLWPIVQRAPAAIHGVKIDVQGMELEALAGMIETLKQWRPRLVVELHAGVSRERVVALLRDCGYASEAVAIEPARSEGAPRFLDNRSYVFEPA